MKYYLLLYINKGHITLHARTARRSIRSRVFETNLSLPGCLQHYCSIPKLLKLFLLVFAQQEEDVFIPLETLLTIMNRSNGCVCVTKG
jgi:hypothetical protein